MSVHIAPEELADTAEGLLEVPRRAVVETHLVECDVCTEVLAALARVSATLAAAPAPEMPDAVFTRLSEVVATERSHHTAQQSVAETEHRTKPAQSPGPGLDDPKADSLSSNTRSLSSKTRSLSSKTRSLYRALLACALAGVVGFGGVGFGGVNFGGFDLGAGIGFDQGTAAADRTPAHHEAARPGTE